MVSECDLAIAEAGLWKESLACRVALPRTLVGFTHSAYDKNVNQTVGSTRNKPFCMTYLMLEELLHWHQSLAKLAWQHGGCVGYVGVGNIPCKGE